MKKITLVLLVLLGFSLKSQTSCENALPFCASGVSGVTFPATTSITTAQTGPNYGCLGSTPNPAWYYLQISNSGNLDILIQGQLTAPPGPGQDVDFICWGPFSSLAGICNSLTAANTIDCSYSGSFTETLNIPTGVAGEYYMVLITNFANVQQDIQFTQFAGTGSTNCSLLSSNSKICAGGSGTVVAINSGSLTAPTYSLNPGNLTNSTGSFVVTPTVTTTYTVYVTGVNNVSLAITQTAVSTVSVDPQPSAAPTVTNTTCTSTVNAFNLGLTFFPATPVPGYTVTWASIPNGILSGSQTTLTGGILPGPYTATITAAGGCTTTTSFSIAPTPPPAIISLIPLNPNQVITCNQPSVTVTSLDAASNYTWSNGIIAPITGSVAVFTGTATGSWTITGVHATSGCVATKTFAITQNITAPTAVISPTFQNITCTLSSISTITASANPTVNVTHQILSPQGGTFSANSHTLAYVPGGVGIYTHCIVNDINGCSTCQTFTVASNQGFPTYSVVSAENFTLGCGTRSTAVINIVNANTTPQGGALSFTLLPPGTPTSITSGTLSFISTYTVSTPGTWTVITKDNLSLCETRNAISILSNTFAPNIDSGIIVPRQILDCNVPRVTLKGQSITPNVSYIWSFPGTPGTQPGDTIAIFANFATPSSSMIANFTLTITDNNSTCKTTTVVPMRQNLYPPKAFISNGGTSSLTCNTQTIMLTNLSSTGIPPATGYPTNQNVIGYIWEGPSPQEPIQVSSTYLAGTVGVYTLTAKDLNNGCTSKTTTTIGDNRIYPIVNRSSLPKPFELDCGSAAVTISTSISNSSNAYVYNWSPPPGATISAGPYKDNILVTKTGNYKVLITNTLNGCSSADELSVINGTLNVSFEADQISGYAPLVVTFTNTSSSSNPLTGQLNIESYWSFGNGTNDVITYSVSQTPVITYQQPGTYKVRLLAVKGTCLDTAYKTISVDIPSELTIPNVFTPNGDGVNDLFFLKSSNLVEITILIYDRWGHKVYDLVSDKGNISWDGKNLYGKEVADGTYFYLIKATGKDGLNYDKKGTVSLYR